ncbi:hypothetical protein ACLO87_09510 [Paenalcaligenes sp. Me52]|uniref:hypothetical protein n=1 Tax=Paenalcaligenes sp. Me52 TaxID=3392038 RepID=UPI003D279D60
MRIKHSICQLFQVLPDEGGVWRVVTPLEYPGTSHNIVIRIRQKNGSFQIDENGDSLFQAELSGGNTESMGLSRWKGALNTILPVEIDENDTIKTTTANADSIPALIFRVAEAAQQAFAIATSYEERQSSAQFKELVGQAVNTACSRFEVPYHTDAILPIAGEFVADFLIDAPSKPLIVIAATGVQRLLEAEIIHMQYRNEELPGFILAAVESQKHVGPKQFERANYYTDKTVTFHQTQFSNLVGGMLH